MTPETLKAWRLRLHLGEAGMASYLGVPVTTYRKWENGTRNPDAAPLRLFAVLVLIEARAPELHTRLLAEVETMTENKPTKGRKGRPATQVSTQAEKRASGPGFASSAPVPPWIHVASALPSWMNGGLQ